MLKSLASPVLDSSTGIYVIYIMIMVAVMFAAMYIGARYLYYKEHKNDKKNNGRGGK